ncbi:Protein of unknown function (DUF3007) [Synechococcus sp. PCC 7502]|uniref:DUF3007 family protein n=1 Tax=Synechococcus sp. PCC 7502 TaxID=1173263 RepID=UPI00029F8E20|nr:DUF3007 family protein [Synechococcus sp. PCC 7502]AFY73370.1 Protein of unknown function (DUF3007) [Synechococcus sp. PCC 7502]
MRRIDAIAITIAFFALGGLAFWGLQVYGLSSENAGIWSQVVLVAGIILWVATYIYRAVTQTMTYNQQLSDYKTAVLKKQLAEMSPEELAKLQAEVDAESSS